MSDYNEPVNQQDKNNKEVRESNTGTDTSPNQSKNSLEKDGPQKKHFNVLNEDGSLADLHENEIQDAGAESASITK